MKRLISTVLCLALMAVLLCVTVSADSTKIKVACVGDSITEGWASTDTSTQSYPAHLQTLLGSGYEVKNFGIGGRTAMKNPDGMTSYWNEANFYGASKSFLPDVVILMLGTNDVVTNNWDSAVYKADLKALVESYQSLASSPAVYLATPPHAYDSDHPTRLQNEAVPAVKEVAQETGASLVDINALTEGMGKHYPDNIHPSDEGYFRLALMFYQNVFSGELAKVTVKTEAGNAVHIGEITEIADDSGNAVLTVPKAKTTLTVYKTAGGFAFYGVDATADTEVDCTKTTLPVNLLGTASISDGDGLGGIQSVTDGDMSTGWQRGDTDYSKSLLIADLGEAKEFDSASFAWEESTRAKKNKYSIEYSADGNSWTAVSNPVFAYTGDFDTVKFDAVTAQYVRLKIDEGQSGKTAPKLYEMAVVNSKDVQTVETQTDENTVSDTNSVAKGNDDIIIYILVSIGIIAVAGVAAAFTVKKQNGKKNGDGNTIS